MYFKLWFINLFLKIYTAVNDKKIISGVLHLCLKLNLFRFAVSLWAQLPSTLIKLRQLAFLNGIVDGSYSKPSGFDCLLQYKSDSNDGFKSTIAILI